jgi:amino acid transporter
LAKPVAASGFPERLLQNKFNCFKTQRMAELKRDLNFAEVTFMALMLIAITAGSLARVGEIKTIGLLTNFFVFDTFLFVNAAVIYLRIKDKEAKRLFRIPGNIGNLPVISMLAMLMILLLGAYTVYGLWPA